MRLSRTRLVGAQLHWLVDLFYAGRTFRLSTEQLEVPSDDGDLLYEGRLESVRVVETRAGSGAEVEAATCELEMTFPVDLVQMRGRGHRLDGALVEVSQLIAGDTWEDRTPRLRGTVSGVQSGEATEPLRLRAVGRGAEDRGVLPPPAARVTSTTFPTAPDLSIGRCGPIVFGEGMTTPGVGVTVSGSLIVRVLIAYHEVAAETVTVTSTGLAGNEQVLDVEHDEDELGRKYAYVDLSTGSYGTTADRDAFRATTAAFFVQWNDGGGLWDDRRLTALTSAGDLLVWLLRQSTVEWDIGRTYTAAARLRGYRVAGYIDEPVTVWDWLQAQLGAVVPVGWTQGAAGVYPVARRRSLRAAEVIAEVDLDAEPGLARVADGTEELEDPANRVAVRFDLDPEDGAYRSTVVLTGHQADLEGNEVPSLLAEISQFELGAGRRKVVDRSIDLDIVADRITAVKVGMDALARGCVPLSTLTLLGSGPDWEWVETGDVWSVTSELLGLEAVLYSVERVERADDGVVGIELGWQRDPARDSWRAA